MANNIVSQIPSISEVKAVLAETANSVGELCTSPKINKWSKCKPIIFDKVGNVSIPDMVTRKCGFYIPFKTSLSEIVSFYRANGMNDYKWEYRKPTGGISSPYRLGDFRNYNGLAERFYSVSEIEEKEIPESTANIFLTVTNKTVESSNVRWGDINFDNHRMGVLTVLKNTNVIHSFDVTNTDLDDYMSLKTLSIAINTLVVGTDYEAFLYIKENGVEKYHPVENGYLGVFRVVAEAEDFYIFAEYKNGNVDYNFHITKSGANKTYNNVTVSLRFLGNEPSDPLQQFEKSIPYGNITVGGGNTHSDSGSFLSVTTSNANMMYVALTSTTDNMDVRIGIYTGQQ